MKAHDNFEQLKPGDIAWFIYLHLETVRLAEKPSHKEKTFLYEVEGKVRPAFVSNGPVGRQHAKWYLIFPMTTKGLEESKKTKEGYKRIGAIIDQEKESYISCHAAWYPAHLISTLDGRSAVIKSLDPLENSLVIKIIGNEVLRG